MKPHKHAEVIKAWADGATVEARYLESSYPESRKWHVVNCPAFSEDWEYRVKPPKKWFRVAIVERFSDSLAPLLMVCSDEKTELVWQGMKGFITWLTDRIEYDDPNTTV